MTIKNSRSLEDELKLIRGILSKIEFDTSANYVKMEVLQNDILLMRTDLKDFEKKLSRRA